MFQSLRVSEEGSQLTWRLILLFALFSPAMLSAGERAELGNQLAELNVLSMTPWHHESQDLKVVVADAEDPRLLFFARSREGWRVIKEEEGETAPVAVFQLTSVGGPLLVVWGTGSGFIVRAYAFRSGQVAKVLDDGSFRMPEILHPNAESDAVVEIVLADAGPGKRATSTRRFRWDGAKFLKSP